MRVFSRIICLVSLVLAATIAAGFEGDNGKPNANKPNKAAKETPKTPVTPEMETEAMSFVRSHHPELVELLNQLKTSNTLRFQEAIRDLSRAATTLATTERNDPKKYVLDLKAWQVNSQVQVLAARMAMGRSPELEAELKARLVEQIDIRLEQQQLDRERTVARLERLDAAIAKTKQTRDDDAKKAFDKLAKTTPAPKPNPKKENRPATGPKKTEKPESK